MEGKSSNGKFKALNSNTFLMIRRTISVSGTRVSVLLHRDPQTNHISDTEVLLHCGEKMWRW